MAQTATSFASVMKDTWTSDTLIKQFEDKNHPLSRFESFKAAMIGTQAQVPIHHGRSYAYTSLGAGGGDLNPDQAQQVSQATYTMPQHWFQIGLEASAIAQAGSNAVAVAKAKDVEIEGAVENMRHQIVRQLVTNGDGIVAHLDSSGGSNVVAKLVPAASEGSAYGYSALVRKWLGVGATVDAGTTADTDALGTGLTISAVSESATAPTVTLSSAINATLGTHYLFVPNPNSATAANPEMNGLRQIVNTTGALGGLNPATAGQEFWSAAARDTTTSVLSLDLLLGFQRAVRQNGGQHTAIWTGLKQRQNLYSLIQNQVRFSGDGDLSAGGDQKVKWNDSELDAFADILDTDLYFLSLADLIRIGAPGYEKPKWASDIEGSNTGSLWKQGSTKFVDGIVWFTNFGAHRRNTHAAATALQ